MPDRLLVDAEPHWPALHVSASRSGEPPARDIFTERRAEVTLRTGGHLTIDRDRGTARFHTPRRLTHDEIVHPYLAAPAIIVSYWAGRMAFHAGAFAHGGGAWGVVGSREAGKSSLLAALATAGHDVVADDVLVIDDGVAFTGPRSIDLREPAAARLGVGRDIGVAGARERWRLELEPMAPALPFRGWIFLAWGERPRMTRVRPSDCLGRLVDATALRVTPAEPATMLDLASRPAWTLERPRDWDRVQEGVHCMLDALAEVADAA